MGAAEKLEALLRRVGDPWPAYDALPEIIAVVKAAQDHNDCECVRTFGKWVFVESGKPCPIHAALSALDERLG